MTRKIELIKCVVLLNLAMVNGFKILVLNNLNENDILTKHRQVFDENKLDSSVETRNGIEKLDADFQRRKLIKTILPHGHEVDFKTTGEAIYKPLVRFHKKKSIFIKDDEYKPKVRSIAKSKKKVEDFFVGIWKDMTRWTNKHFGKKKPKPEKPKKNLRAFINYFNNKTKFDATDGSDTIFSKRPNPILLKNNKPADVAKIWEMMKALKFKYNEKNDNKSLVRINRKKPIKDNGYKTKAYSIVRTQNKEDELLEYDEIHPKVALKDNQLAEDVASIWRGLKELKLKHHINPKEVKTNSRKNLRTFANRFITTNLISKGVDSFMNVLREALPRNVQKRKKPKTGTLRVPPYEFSVNLGDEDYRRGRSGEELDPLAPGKIPFNIELQEDTTRNPAQWEPTYSFWNYWTYDKTLHQDSCGDGYVRYKDKCIGSPPH